MIVLLLVLQVRGAFDAAGDLARQGHAAQAVVGRSIGVGEASGQRLVDTTAPATAKRAAATNIAAAVWPGPPMSGSSTVCGVSMMPKMISTMIAPT